MMFKELSMLSSPTAWFVILVTIHLVTQTTLQGEALDRNAFGLSVLTLIAEAPQNGLKVDLGNNSAVLLPQLENFSTTVNLPSTETDLSRTSVAPSSFSTISPSGTTSSVSVTPTSTTRSRTSSKPASVATLTTAKEGKVTNSAVPRPPGITSDGEGSDDEPDDDESDDDESDDDESDDDESDDDESDDESDDDDTDASDETNADVSLGDSVAESLKAVVGKPLSELRSAAEGFVDSVESDFDNAVAGLVKRTGLKSPHRRRRMHKVPTSLRDQLKRRKEEHESDSELDRGSEVGFAVLGLQANGRQLIVTEACAESLEWPIELLTHAQRENITFVFFQAWLAVLSLVALAYGSVPHLLAVIICHLLALGYSVFQTFSTKYFHDRFHREIVEKSCNGSELLPRYWEDVLHLRIATLVVEGIVTSLLAAVAWRLWKIMDWKTWKLIGASKGHGRLYKLLLSYRIALQMGAFFIVAFQALWLNEICHARGRGMSGVFLTDGYKALLVFLIVFLPLWLVLGWHIVEGPKSRLSEGGKKVMNVLKVDGLGRKIGWRGGKGWGMTGKRGKNIRLAVFGVGAGAVFFNEVFLLSKLRGWDWSFLTFVGSIATGLTILICVLGVFGVYLSRHVVWDESDNSTLSIEDDYDEKEKMQIAFPNEVEPYIFVDNMQGGISVPRGFDMVAPPAASGERRAATLNRSDSQSSNGSLTAEGVKRGNTSSNPVPALSNKRPLVFTSQAKEVKTPRLLTVRIPAPIMIPPRASHIATEPVPSISNIKSRFSATTVASSPVSLMPSNPAQSRFSSPTATESAPSPIPPMPALPSQNRSHFSMATNSSGHDTYFFEGEDEFYQLTERPAQATSSQIGEQRKILVAQPFIPNLTEMRWSRNTNGEMWK